MLHGTAIALGAGVCAWVAYMALVAKPIVLFSWHPVCFTLAYLLTTPSALLAMSSRRAEANFAKRSGLLEWHVYMQTATVLLMVAGFGAIYVNKERNGWPHFQTTHSLVGCAAVGGYLLNYVGGVLKRGQKNPKDLPHRIAGAISFLLSGAALCLGFYSGGWGKTNFGPTGQLAACILIGLMHVATVVRMLSTPAAAATKDE
ncbi:hypothetical protein SDRG_05731 [Saprolegnia diclina VS20]|uniref:Cytochrome b561 domain-containing protein n=1 Tax=Saprolegnia diclina (strain VS20) TaxID=1156394 RepID=T0S248_SAPDV|nr:hypothetical protein SDRG_05731 [Saprolegnia diclina VS20]EQC36902.1 hypothetical protein SDRG_05731 [Saprolegnia diclina VS20]|eukprot:XP_008609683.1 hypothetical protein SDRG_05731 [Saprolegnia diclina VS20]